MNWPQIKLGEVLTQHTDYIGSPELRIYPKLSVRLYGRGVVLDAPTDGSALKMKRHQIAKVGQVILSEIWGKKGAIGLVPPEGDGALCTSHFFLFDVHADKIAPRYLQSIFQGNYLQGQLDAEAKGTTGYAAVRPKHLLAATIPLPSLTEQRRIVARIEELSTKVDEAHGLRQQSAKEAEGLMASRLMYIFDEAVQSQRALTRLGDVCIFQGGSQPSKLQFAYEPRDGYVRLIQIRDYKSNDYLTFVPRDSVRKFCSAEDVMIGRYGPPIFQILRGIKGAYNVALMKATPDESRLSRDFLFRLLQEPRFFKKVEEDSQRTSGQTGIRRELLEGHVTFVPPLHEQRRIVSYLNDFEERVVAVRKLQEETAVELNALIPSILSRAFSGEL